jgi:coenzyme F420 hydrogenase subunit beta
MKAIETIITLRYQYPAKLKSMVPNHVWQLVQAYGLKPERKEDKSS